VLPLLAVASLLLVLPVRQLDRHRGVVIELSAGLFFSVIDIAIKAVTGEVRSEVAHIVSPWLLLV